jgi:hypothetical protein
MDLNAKAFPHGGDFVFSRTDQINPAWSSALGKYWSIDIPGVIWSWHSTLGSVAVGRRLSLPANVDNQVGRLADIAALQAIMTAPALVSLIARLPTKKAPGIGIDMPRCASRRFGRRGVMIAVGVIIHVHVLRDVIQGKA